MTSQPNEIVNILAKAQTKLLENFVETSFKMQKAMDEKEIVEAFIKVYDEWYTSQIALVEDLITSLKTHADVDLSYLNTHVDNLKKMHGNYGKQWTEMLQEISKTYFGKEFLRGEDNNIDLLNQYWNKFYSFWFEPFAKPFKEFSSSGFGAYNVMLETAKDYMKAFYPTTFGKE